VYLPCKKINYLAGFGVDANTEEGDRKGAEHSQPKASEWVPAQVESAQDDCQRPY
jgi:hypothetical protein